MKIYPSIYEKTPQDFLNQINKLFPFFSYFQIDVSDGVYAPNKTIQIKDFFSAIQHCNNLKVKDSLFDFHLMVADYKTEVEKLRSWRFGKLGNILIHYSLKPNLSLLTNHQPPIGLVLNSNDTVKNLTKDYDLEKIPVIQIMTVEIGAQGNPFLSKNLKKIEQLKKAGFLGKIFLDGGINNITLSQILSQKYQPDVLCVGSYLTKNPDLRNNVFTHNRKQNVDFLKHNE